MQDNQALIVVDVQKDFLETGALPVNCLLYTSPSPRD